MIKRLFVMRTFLKSVLLSFLVFVQFSASAQSVACPEVFIGGVSDTAHINFGCSATNPQCTTLVAQFPDIRQTVNGANAYIVNSIPFSGNEGFDIPGSTAVSVGFDDIYSPSVSLPFNFCYYGNTYNHCYIGANGVISFDDGNAPTCFFGVCFENEDYDPSYCAIPCVDAGGFGWAGQSHLNTIFACFHDIDPSSVGSVKYKLIGSAPCRKLVVNWYQIPIFSCNSQISTFQCVLYENTNVIEVYIQNKGLCPTAGTDENAVIIGVQNATGTQAVAAPGRNTDVVTISNEAWQFVPNGSTLLTSVNLYESGTNTLVQAGSAVPSGTAGLLQATFNNVCVSQATAPDGYYVKADYNSCSGTNFSATTPVVMDIICSNAPPTVNSPIAYCQGATATPLTAIGTSLLWYTSATGGVGSPTAPTPSTATAGSTTYYVSQTVGGVESPRAAITVNVSSQPTIAFTQEPNPFCVGQASTTISAGSQVGTSYVWSTGETTNTIQATTGGTVSVTANPGTSCSATGTYNIVTGGTAPAIYLGTEKSSCCQNIVLNATPDSSLTYRWNTGDTTGRLLVHSSNTIQREVYTLTATSSNGCYTVVTDTVSIWCINAQGVATPDSIRAGESSILTVNTEYASSYVYSWGSDPTLVSQDSMGIATPTQTTYYTVTVSDLEHGCVDSAVVPVVIIVPGLVAMPSAFTPNGDGNNDFYFPVYFTNQAKVSDFRIYNRWGQLLYSNVGLPGWDGKYKGEEQPTDVYTYYLNISVPDPNNLTSTLEIKKQGSFTLLR